MSWEMETTLRNGYGKEIDFDQLLDMIERLADTPTSGESVGAFRTRDALNKDIANRFDNFIQEARKIWLPDETESEGDGQFKGYEIEEDAEDKYYVAKVGTSYVVMNGETHETVRQKLTKQTAEQLAVYLNDGSINEVHARRVPNKALMQTLAQLTAADAAEEEDDEDQDQYVAEHIDTSYRVINRASGEIVRHGIKKKADAEELAGYLNQNNIDESDVQGISDAQFRVLMRDLAKEKEQTADEDPLIDYDRVRVWTIYIKSTGSSNPPSCLQVVSKEKPTFEEVKDLWDSLNHGVPLKRRARFKGEHVIQSMEDKLLPSLD